MLKYRILTAAILIPLVIGMLYMASIVQFSVITGLIISLAAWEWSRLNGITAIIGRILYILLVILSLIMAIAIPIRWILWLGCLGWVAVLFWLLGYAKLEVAYSWQRTLAVLRGLCGMWILTVCWVSLSVIRAGYHGIANLLFMLALICGADTAAYFVGRRYGKHKLAPRISPGKTWEGVGGAFVAILLITLADISVMHVAVNEWPGRLNLAIMTLFSSIVGDLFISMLKRQVGLKDSGKLLPGHGGILDRIDSLTAAAPIFALGLFWLNVP